MAEKMQSQGVMEVTLPEAGKTVEYQLSADIPVKLSFFVSEVMFSCTGDDLILTGENGGSVVMKDYRILALDGNLPDFELNGGETVPGDIYLFAFNSEALDIETAAGGDEQGGELFDEVAPGSVYENFDLPEVEDSSSMLDVLRFNDLFSASDGHSVFGAAQLQFDAQMTCSLADSINPIDDAISMAVPLSEYI